MHCNKDCDIRTAGVLTRKGSTGIKEATMLKNTLPLLLILCLITVLPVAAARIDSSTVIHMGEVFQAYQGHSPGSLLQKGDAGTGSSVITAAPGILAIDPGDALWKNYLSAGCAGVKYGLKNVTFTKDTPSFIQCGYDSCGKAIFPPHTITQQGTSHIRLWWPLMYELPGTVFTLNILYGTPSLFDNDGPGPNTPAWVHLEQWMWKVELDIEHFEYLIELFHELPFGKSEVPLISDEALYDWLRIKVADARNAINAGKLPLAAQILGEIELELPDHLLGMTPAYPNPTGACTGIANTDENPTACVIIVDIEYLLLNGIAETAK